MDFRKSGRFCTGKCVKFSYIYIKNAIPNSKVLVSCKNVFMREVKKVPLKFCGFSTNELFLE